MFALLTAPWPIIPFHTLCSWYNNDKVVIIFQVAFASPHLALPAVATSETANYTIARVALHGITEKTK